LAFTTAAKIISALKSLISYPGSGKVNSTIGL